MQTTKSIEPKKRIFFCWNSKDHPDFQEYKWDQEYRPGQITNCPICGMSHKVTLRMSD